jgi:anti-sigma factor RsiW
MWRPVTKEELMLYVDGRLPRAREHAVAIHLEANPREAQRIEAYCRQNELLADLGDAIALELPQGGEARLKRLVAAHAARTRRRRAGMLAAALAVVAVIGLGAIQMIHGWRGPTAVASMRTTLTHIRPAALSSAAR